MTKVKVNPGPCGFTGEITAQLTGDEDEVQVAVATGCPAVNKMLEELGNTFEPYSICMKKPGSNAFYEYASEKFPIHAGCATLIALTKAIEAEAGLALKKNVTIEFEA